MINLNSRQLVEKLRKECEKEQWLFSYDRKEESVRIESKRVGKGVTLKLSPLLSKINKQQLSAYDEVLYYIRETLKTMEKEPVTSNLKAMVYPVIRSASFPRETEDGKKLVFDEHTNETTIFYAIDFGNTYRLIDEAFLEKEKITKENIKEWAKWNVYRLKTTVKKDEVAGNFFYFVNTFDGYDASRILNETFLSKMEKEITGQMAVAVPHQDVLIIADIKNDEGYDVLGQMTFQFFMNGRNPITALPFLYDDKKLEPTFILAKKKRIDKEEGKKE